MPKIKNHKRKYLENGGSYYYDKQKETWYFAYRQKVNGKNIRKQLQAKTESLLRCKIKEFEEELNNPTKPKIITLSDMIEMWFANSINDNVALNTLRFYRDKAHFIIDALGDKDITKVTIDDVELFLNKLSTSGGVSKSGLAPSSVNATRKLLSSVYTYAIQHRLATINPTIGIRPKKNLVKIEQNDLCILDEKEMSHFLDVAKKGDYIYNGVKDKRELVINDSITFNVKTAYMIVLLGFATGMRIGELRGLSRDNLDLEHHKINVTHQLLRYGPNGKIPRKAYVDKLIQKANKSKKQADIRAAANANPFQPLKTTNSKRVIDIDPLITKELIDYLAYQDAYASTHSNYKNEWDILFTTGIGTPVDEKNFRNRYFDKMLKESGIKKPLTLHKMRHTHASILLKHGIDISVVSRRLGHANPSITYNIYVHVLPESMVQAGKVWSEIMANNQS